MFRRLISSKSWLDEIGIGRNDLPAFRGIKGADKLGVHSHGGNPISRGPS